jgi:hypothetical protein
VAAPTTRIEAMPWLCPLTLIQPWSARKYATASETTSAMPAVPMTSSGSSGLR